MPEIQEFTLQSPDMMHDFFYIKKEGKLYQKWETDIVPTQEIEFYLEAEKMWLKGKVDSSYIDDGSGNAPGANAHCFIILERDKKKYRYVLHSDLKIRVEAPTEAELIEMSGRCQGGDWEDGWHSPATWHSCLEHGTRYVTKHGQAEWYCDKHKPEGKEGDTDAAR